MASPVLPPFIYQMMDHLYISDIRGFAFHELFNLVIDTTNVFLPGTVEHIPLGSQTIQERIKPDPLAYSTVHELCGDITNATHQYQKILLYSEHYDTSVLIVYTYLTSRYHFNNADIGHMMSTRPFNQGLTLAFQTVLSKK